MMSPTLRSSRLLAAIVGIVFMLTSAWLLAWPIDLSTADLGRHITNGSLVVSGEYNVFTTNYYSATHPDFPFVNHHWGSGVLLYALHAIGGFTGLHVFLLLVFILTIGLIFWFSYTRYGVGTTALSLLIFLPLIVSRHEARPEILSTLAAVLFFILLTQYWEGRLRARTLVIALGGMMLVWVNVHIYFALGIALVGAFLVAALFERRWSAVRTFGIALGVCAGAAFVTPIGIAGALAPFTIFTNYGYLIVENQSILFLRDIAPRPIHGFFVFAFAVLVISFLARSAFAIYQKSSLWRSIHLPHLFVAAGMSILAWQAIRNFSIFGLLAVPIVAANIHAMLSHHFHKSRAAFEQYTALFAGVLVLFILIGGFRPIFPAPPERGIGLASNVNGLATFIHENNIPGPLFNNYDIGGYLIFHLFPDERVFVDNRPEAYPASFFQDEYIPMQEDDTVWTEIAERYAFSSIVFSHRDATPWAQQFLISRVQDPAWAVVYVDAYGIVFVERTDEHQSLIEQYEIPPEAFTVR